MTDAQSFYATHEPFDYNWGKTVGSSTPEGRVKRRFNERLRKLNLVWKYMPVPGGMGLPTLDYLLCVAGHFVAIEAKANASKKPTPRQEATMADIRAAGGIVLLIDDDASIDAAIGAIVILSGASAS